MVDKEFRNFSYFSVAAIVFIFLIVIFAKGTDGIKPMTIMESEQGLVGKAFETGITDSQTACIQKQINLGLSVNDARYYCTELSFRAGLIDKSSLKGSR